MTEITVRQSQAMAALAGFVDNDELATVRQVGVLSLKGGRFRVQFDGQERLLTDSGTKAPVTALNVVFLKISPGGRFRAKRYYGGKKYTEGSKDAPVCFSMDGMTPDPSIASPVATACQGCPKNVFGSAKSENGKDIKACADYKRAAFVPEGNLKNEKVNGPMLLNLPTMTVAALTDFRAVLQHKYGGIPYNAVVTQLTFDPSVSYPKLLLEPIRQLTDEEMAELTEHYTSGKVDEVVMGRAEVAQPSAGLTAVATPEPEPEPAPVQAAAPMVETVEDVEGIASELEDEEPEPAPPPKKTRQRRTQSVTGATAGAAPKAAAAAPAPTVTESDEASALDDLFD